MSFIAGLLTYEGAIVLPALLFLAHAAVRRSVTGRKHFLIFMAMAFIYLIAWNVFFHFRITRFPVETSVAAGLFSLWTAMRHSLHGSSRFLALLVYASILTPMAIDKTAARFAVIASVWVVLAFAPFLLVHGYADRFAYLGSAGVAGLLSFGLIRLWSRSHAVSGILAAGLLLFFAAGTQSRIPMWKHAGEITRRIPSENKGLRVSSHGPRSSYSVFRAPGAMLTYLRREPNRPLCCNIPASRCESCGSHGARLRLQSSRSTAQASM